MNSVREQAYVVGPKQSLVAVVTEPTKSSEALPGVVMLNTGIIHRVGHQRKFVILARALAGKGHTTVRFDFSGIGDSEARADALTPMEGCMADIHGVLDWLEATRKLKRFVLVGLCSGADHAVVYAGSDPRVVGIALVDPSIPPTRRYYLHYFSRRFIRPSSWAKFLTGRGRLANLIKKRLSISRDDEAIVPPDLDDKAVREFLQNVYSRAVENGTQILAIFAGANDHRQSYREQIVDAIPALRMSSLLQTEFLRECDHLFLFECDRKRLNSIIIDWIDTAPFLHANSRELSAFVQQKAMLFLGVVHMCTAVAV